MTPEFYAGIVVGFSFGFLFGFWFMLELTERLWNEHVKKVHSNK